MRSAPGGLPAAEITLRTPAGIDAIPVLRRSHPEALIGAGAVRSPEDARRAIGGGAQFVVSSGTDQEVMVVCRELKVPALPGACTPTEIGGLGLPKPAASGKVAAGLPEAGTS